MNSVRTPTPPSQSRHYDGLLERVVLPCPFKTSLKAQFTETYGPPRRQVVSAIWFLAVCINVSGL